MMVVEPIELAETAYSDGIKGWTGC